MQSKDKFYGNANCADCHDIGGIALVARVNVTTANDSNAIHKNLNINASGTNSTAYYNNSKRCWACHGNGSEPSTPNAHPTTYKVPDNCTDCHIQSAAQNFNFTPNSTLLNVTEHYWNATEIRTPAVSTCYACHNKSKMMLPANDPDAGSGAVYGGANGGSNSTSHYGKKRVDLRIGENANCSYCHNNASGYSQDISWNNDTTSILVSLGNLNKNNNSEIDGSEICHLCHNASLTGKLGAHAITVRTCDDDWCHGNRNNTLNDPELFNTPQNTALNVGMAFQIFHFKNSLL